MSNTNSRFTTAGFRCGVETDIYSGKITGVIRASMGAMTTIGDVEAFIAFISEFYVEKTLSPAIAEVLNVDDSGKLCPFLYSCCQHFSSQSRKDI
jgi:molybdenum cofactor sulfurtransferase